MAHNLKFQYSTFEEVKAGIQVATHTVSAVNTANHNLLSYFLSPDFLLSDTAQNSLCRKWCVQNSLDLLASINHQDSPPQSRLIGHPDLDNSSMTFFPCGSSSVTWTIKISQHIHPCQMDAQAHHVKP